MSYFDARTDRAYKEWVSRQKARAAQTRHDDHIARGLRGSWRAPLAVVTTLATVLLGVNFVARLTAAPAVPAFDHVFVVVMENHSYNEVVGSSSAPYISALASANGLASNYKAVAHPSLPNYLALAGGSTFGITSDCSPTTCPVNAPNLVDRLESAGKTWKAYMESMPSPCYTGASSGTYAAKHNPFIYFDDVRNNPVRCAQDVPYTALGTDLLTATTTPNFAWITPNLCSDMHDCSVATGDKWLQTNLPKIFASPAWTTQRSTLFLTWDEDDGSASNHIPMIVVSSGGATPAGTVSSATFNHYSWLKTVETAWGMPSLGSNDTGAAAMTELFPGSVAPAPTPSPSASPSAEPSCSTPTPTATPTATATPTPTATPTATPTPTPDPGSLTSLTVNASEDATVTSAAPTSNFAGDPSLRASSGPIRHAYLKFTVQGLGVPVSSAALQLYTTAGGNGYSAHPTTNAWSQSAITYRNAPAYGATMSRISPAPVGQWLSLDVAPSVTGNGTFSFVLTSASAVTFASNEAGSGTAPRLVINNSRTAGAMRASTALTVCPSPTPQVVTTPTPTATPTPTVDPTATPLPAASNSLPLRAAFFYPWFPEGWNQQGMNPFTHYHPSAGFYSDRDATILTQQIAAMQYGGMQAGISSWWGQGSEEDGKFPLMLQLGAATGFKWALYYEAEGNGISNEAGSPNPTSAQIASDLAYINSHYASNPAYLHLNGKPVIFAYGDPSDGCGMADRWKQAGDAGFYVVLKVFGGFQNCASQPDNWHQYGPSSSQNAIAGHSFAVSPGFYKANESSPRLARDTSAFTAAVQAMVASRAPLQLVTTFNEWGEGTAVESAQEWASDSGNGSYLDILHNVLGSA